MANPTFSKLQIASHQLDVAIRLFLEGDYLSSLTLAGAAEEILGNLSEKAGLPVAIKEITEFHKADTDPAIPEEKHQKTIASILNKARNAAKHVISPDDTEFVVEQMHPLMMIMRAMPMAKRLGLPPSGEADMVKWIKEHPEARQ